MRLQVLSQPAIPRKQNPAIWIISDDVLITTLYGVVIGAQRVGGA